VAAVYASVVDVLLLLVRDGQVLLALREGAGSGDFAYTDSVAVRSEGVDKRES
jgi:hypothetical protein